MSSEYVEIAQELLASAKTGALAVLDSTSQHPIVTLVNVVCDENYTPLLLMSTLSAHHKNLLFNAKCSLLISRMGKGDALAHPRITLIGEVLKIDKAEKEFLYLSKNKKAALYYNFGDFSLFALTVETVHFNGGFGKAASLTWQEIKF